MKEEMISIPAEEHRREALFRKAKVEAAKSGVKIEGDTKTGKFAGDTIIGAIGGTYRTDSNLLYITVTKKPSLVPDSTLKRILVGVFTDDD